MQSTKNILLRNGKRATGKTIESIRGETEATATSIKIRIKGKKSLLFVITGRRKGAPLPVRKVGSRFELFPELKAWKQAIGFSGADFLLARAISKKGIPPLPLPSLIVQENRSLIISEITQIYVREVGQVAGNIVRQNFRGLGER